MKMFDDIETDLHVFKTTCSEIHVRKLKNDMQPVHIRNMFNLLSRNYTDKFRI